MCVVLSAINEESSTLPALLTDYILNGKNPLHSSYHTLTELHFHQLQCILVGLRFTLFIFVRPSCRMLGQFSNFCSRCFTAGIPPFPLDSQLYVVAYVVAGWFAENGFTLYNKKIKVLITLLLTLHISTFQQNMVGLEVLKRQKQST